MQEPSSSLNLEVISLLHHIWLQLVTFFHYSCSFTYLVSSTNSVSFQSSPDNRYVYISDSDSTRCLLLFWRTKQYFWRLITEWKDLRMRIFWWITVLLSCFDLPLQVSLILGSWCMEFQLLLYASVCLCLVYLFVCKKKCACVYLSTCVCQEHGCTVDITWQHPSYAHRYWAFLLLWACWVGSQEPCGWYWLV